MINVSITLPDDVESALTARVTEGGYTDLADYVRALIESDMGVEDDWEMTPELAAALEEGERSGISPYSFDEIIANAKRKAGLRVD